MLWRHWQYCMKRTILFQFCIGIFLSSIAFVGCEAILPDVPEPETCGWRASITMWAHLQKQDCQWAMRFTPLFPVLASGPRQTPFCGPITATIGQRTYCETPPSALQVFRWALPATFKFES